MQYSSEIQEMCRVAQGTNHGPAPIPQEGTWTKGQRGRRHQRTHPRHRLVRAAAGRLQAYPECGRWGGLSGGLVLQQLQDEAQRRQAVEVVQEHLVLELLFVDELGRQPLGAAHDRTRQRHGAASLQVAG